jgi:citrate lyase synthetase
VIARLRVQTDSEADDVIDDDLILIWSDEKRVITGSDILGRLLRGIALRDIK